MKLLIIFVVVSALVGLLSAQPVDNSLRDQPVEFEASGAHRFKRMTAVNCPQNYTRLNRKCVRCDVYEDIMDQGCPGRRNYKGQKRHYIF